MTDTGKPHAKGGMMCPLWKKKMSAVCHNCEWWTHLRGKHPQGEEILDQWGCAIAWLPMLMVENSQMQRQTGASVDKVANVMAHAAHESTALRGQMVGRIIGSISQPMLEQLTDESHNRSS
jgi:hypothetical protein